MMNTFDRWRAEIENDLAAAAAERDAALLEHAEAERAEATIRAELAAAETALHGLGRRIAAEEEIERLGASVLRPAPAGAGISVALTLRLDELRAQARVAHTRAVSAGHAVKRADARVADLRLAQQQLDLLAAPAADDEAAA